jgi:glucose/arabinose dehydrogenase
MSLRAELIPRALGEVKCFAALSFAALALCLASRPSSAQPSLPDGFRDSVMVTNLSAPVGMAFLPGGRLLFVEQVSARVRLVVNGALSGTDPVGTIDSVNTNGSERGLLGIAVDPGWPARPYIYVHCNHTGNSTLRISRYTLQGDLDGTAGGALTIVAGSRRDILRGVPDNAFNHNGGTLRFGPDDLLYASFGEDASACSAQDTTSLRGVILRLDVSGVPAGGGPPPSLSSITPAGNPFLPAGSPRSQLIWAYGLRNPFRFHTDETAQVLFIADVGENTNEEIDRITTGGRDLGWPNFEGFDSRTPGCALNGTHTPPVYSYDHNEGSAVISGGVYRAASGLPAGFPAEYQGDYFFSDYYSGFVRRLNGGGTSWSLEPAPGQPNGTDWATGFGEVSDWLVGPDGMLWYCRQSVNFNSNTGRIGAIAGGGSPTPPPPPPTVSVAIRRGYPVPSLGTFTLDLDLGDTVSLLVSVHALDGRRVRTVQPRQTFASGPLTISWDGLDDEGNKAPSGLYVVRVSGPWGERSVRVPLVR